MKDFFMAIFYIFITIGVFVLTYYSTKFISKRAGITSRTKNLQLLEKIPLGKDKQAAILRVGDEYYLVGISGQSVNFSNPLSETAASKLVLEEPAAMNFNHFAKNSNSAGKDDKNPSIHASFQSGLLGSDPIQLLINKIAELISGLIEKAKGRINEAKEPKYTDYTK